MAHMTCTKLLKMCTIYYKNGRLACKTSVPKGKKGRHACKMSIPTRKKVSHEFVRYLPTCGKGSQESRRALPRSRNVFLTSKSK